MGFTASSHDLHHSEVNSTVSVTQIHAALPLIYHADTRRGRYHRLLADDGRHSSGAPGCRKWRRSLAMCYCQAIAK